LKAWQRVPCDGRDRDFFCVADDVLSRDDLRSSFCSMESLLYMAGPLGRMVARKSLGLLQQSHGGDGAAFQMAA
jgi:hypothetical protein